MNTGRKDNRQHVGRTRTLSSTGVLFSNIYSCMFLSHANKLTLMGNWICAADTLIMVMRAWEVIHQWTIPYCSLSTAAQSVPCLYWTSSSWCCISGTPGIAQLLANVLSSFFIVPPTENKIKINGKRKSSCTPYQ